MQPNITTKNYLPMEQTPEISIITINYNGLRETCMLVESLRRHVSTAYELIIVDNGSAVNEAEVLQQRYPETLCIRSEINRGFSGGNNIGIQAAKGKYLLFLNNDTYVTDDSLHFLCEKLDSKPEIGGVSPKIKFAFSPQHIQFAGYTPLSAVTLRNSLIGFDEKDRGQYNSSIAIPYLHGAAMMIKKEIVGQVGLMPEIYFLYYEELDWCTRMTEKGYELWYEPRATVFHQESRTTGQNSPLKVFYLTRNRLLYAWRHRRGGRLILSLLYQWGIAAPKNILINLSQARFRQALAILKGGFAFLALKNKTK